LSIELRMRGAGMSELPAKLVVRRASPLRRLMLAAAIVAVLAALYLSYELGRHDGGYDVVAAMEQRDAFQATIRKLEKANSDLNARVAQLDTLRVGRTQERTELGHTIGELQAQVARQTQEIAFYRSVMSESAAPRGTGLELRQVRITPGSAAGRYQVHLTLLERTRPEAEAKGTLRLSVHGSRDGKPVTLDEAALIGAKSATQPFSFRYFERFDQEIALPEGFQPRQLVVVAETRGRKSAAPLTQTFPWRVEAP
jgi:hypothetical protein